MSAYVLDNKAELEELRLRALEAWCDPITTEHLTKLGVAPGWRCLEVGAGRGSIASWLADRVGEGGKVVAIDLDLTLLEKHRRPNLELRRMNVLEGPLPEHEFDLVHARHVVGHLGTRRHEAIRRMAAALKPRGYLVIEDNDFVWNETKEWPFSDAEMGALLQRVWIGLAKVFETGGYDITWGRRIAPALLEAGLVEVAGEARAQIRGRTEESAALTRLPIVMFREALLRTGIVTEAELERAFEWFARPDVKFVGTSPLIVSAWGRRPF
jgi:SAM-dependent methyltransferase